MEAHNDVALPLRVEASLYDFEPDFVPPGFHIVARPDRLHWSSRSTHYGSNRVAWVKWTEDQAEYGIDEVLEYYRERDRAFSWCLGPSSTPSDLALRLAARGLVCIDTSWMLTGALPIAPLRTNPELRITEVSDEAGLLAHAEISQATHGHWSPEEFTEALNERRSYLAFPLRRGGFLLGYLGEKVVANAGWRDSTDGSCVYLTGAHTLPEYRNRGVYSTLLAYRLAEAGRRGCRYAAIRANPLTSAPILLKRGFVSHGVLPMYALRTAQTCGSSAELT